MNRNKRLSALAIPVLLLTQACSFRHQDSGKFESLPLTCAIPQDAPQIQKAVAGVFTHLPGSHFLEVESALPGFIDNNEFFQNLHCKAEASLDANAAAATSVGQPQSRTLRVTLTLYIRGKQHGRDSTEAASQLLKPGSTLLKGAALTPEQGVGDEAYSWWETEDPGSNSSWRDVVFRVSNMDVQVKLTGNNRSNGTDVESRAVGEGTSPQLRQDLERNALDVAKAVSDWLQHDRKS